MASALDLIWSLDTMLLRKQTPLVQSSNDGKIAQLRNLGYPTSTFPALSALEFGYPAFTVLTAIQNIGSPEFDTKP